MSTSCNDNSEQTNNIKKEYISIIKRQTDYDEETIITKLREHENDIEQIILEYHNVDLNAKQKQIESSLTTNQKIFKTIRDFF